mgnify:FL=1
MIIAIDGPAAAGKGTLARNLASRFNLALLDTGLLYRGVGKKLLEAFHDPSDEFLAEIAALDLVFEDLDVESLRNEEVASAASKVSAFPAVRSALLNFQRKFAISPGAQFSGAVLDGRDIGTVVCPTADIKVFITASIEIRAKRRYKELMERGLNAIYSRVLNDMQNRDTRDTERAAAPLAAARDAHVIDTSELEAEKVFDLVEKFILRKSNNR